MPTIYTGMSRVDRTGSAIWGSVILYPEVHVKGTKKKKTNRRARGREVHPTRDDLSQPTR